MAADAVHYPASLIKVPVLIAAHRAAQLGRLSMDDVVEVHESFDSALAGARFTTARGDDQDPATWGARGSVVRLGELAERMITVSGNLATNLVFERLAPGAPDEVLRLAGCSIATTVVRGIGDDPARAAGLENWATAEDLTALVGALARGQLLPARATRCVEDALGLQLYRQMIPSVAPDGAWVGNKTGWVDGVDHDLALLRAAGRPPLALAVLCTGGSSQAERQDLVREAAAEALAAW